MTMTMIRMMVLAAALGVTPAAASAAVPAEPGQGTWAAWHGCWRAQGETTGPMVCMLPGDAPEAVRIATVADGVITSETVVRADGTARTVSEGGCTGTERAFFSTDGRRVFTRAELQCGGVARVSTGVIGMLSEIAWLDAQAVTVDDNHSVRSVQYRIVPQSDVPAAIVALLPRDQQMAQESARLHASAPLEIEMVIEASKVLAPPVTEALLAAHAQGFGLNGRKLVQLADAGVPESTIDMMVALSHPTRFAVATEAEMLPMDPDRQADIDRRSAWSDECYDPYWSSRRYNSFDRCYDARRSRYSAYDGYGYYGRYGYSPFGYDPYGWNRGNSPVIVIVRPGDGDGEGEERTRGSVVKGRGYTRDTGPSSGTATQRGTATTRRDPAPARSGTTTSSGSGSSTREPATTTTTRTAKPRGGN
jgi:hypothetical protein